MQKESLRISSLLSATERVEFKRFKKLVKTVTTTPYLAIIAVDSRELARLIEETCEELSNSPVKKSY